MTGMEKLTLFEFHLDGAQFGPRSLTDEAVEESTEDDETAESTGGNRVLRLVAASILVSLIATAIARRFAGNDEDELVVDDGEDISIDTIEAE